MKGYKAFNLGWKCKDFQYEIGKTYELPEGQKLKMCKCGFHFCKNPIDVFGYYPMNGETLIAEVEALGDIQQEGTKYCTDKIKIIKEFTSEQLRALILNGDHNSGSCNSGSCNSGSFNSGDFNSGDHNSGSCNSRDGNSGSYNSGDGNNGDHNSGSYNSGDGNSGSYNSGNRNAGSYNSGFWNSGDFNRGDCNSGIFNTNEPKMRAFNRECDITMTEFNTQLDYDWDAFCERIFNNNLLETDYDRIKALPNFDAEIFKEITGIEV